MFIQDLGKLEGERTIHLEGVMRVCLTTPRRVTLPLMTRMQEEIEQMLQLDAFEPVIEPAEWCWPIVVVPKGDSRARICVDSM